MQQAVDEDAMDVEPSAGYCDILWLCWLIITYICCT